MRVLNRKNATFLILLSCLTYSTAYIGRLCYGANLSLIRGEFGVDQAIAGTVSSSTPLSQNIVIPNIP